MSLDDRRIVHDDGGARTHHDTGKHHLLALRVLVHPVKVLFGTTKQIEPKSEDGMETCTSRDDARAGSVISTSASRLIKY